MEEVLIPLGALAFLTGIIWILMSGTVRMMNARTLREAARTNPDSLDAVAARLAAPPLQLRGETVGLLSMALGSALAVAGLIGAPDTRIMLLQASLLPGFMGAALFGQRWLPRVANAAPVPPLLGQD